VAVVLAALTAAVLGGGIFLLVQHETGTRAQAHVTSCTATGSAKYRKVHCDGSWTVGGSLLDGGHVVDGADQGDVGKTIDVTVRGDTAYSRNLTLPIVLTGLGLLPLAGLVLVVRGLFRRKSPPRSAG
jgi:hypothetical protein